jgi:hypothetical protein
VSVPTTVGAGITLESALIAARQTLASVTESAKQPGYYSGARTDIINAHAELMPTLTCAPPSTCSSRPPPGPAERSSHPSLDDKAGTPPS